VRIALKDFLALRRPAFEASVSGALDLTGTLAMPELRGALKVDHGIIRPARLPNSAPSLEPDPTIVVVNAPPTAPEPPPPPPPPLLEQLRLDIEVELGDDVSVRRVDAHIRLGGKVRVRREPGGPIAVEGLIRLLRGWYAFQGRRFEIRQGVVWFSGEVPPRPSLDVVAEHGAGEYTVLVHIDGWIDKPRLTLSSEPPLDQADVLAVLLFGKPSRSLGRGDGLRLQQNAVALASGYVMPELQASVMDTLGLSSLEVSMPDGTDPGRVGVGRYVTSDLFVSVAQEFGARAAEVLSVEYGLTPRISVRGTTSTRGSGGIDVFWSRRY
jgi:translocation and assembly module TamB